MLQSSLLLVQILAAMQPLGDLEGLPFGADGGRVGGQVARGGDQRVGGLGRAAQQRVLGKGGLDRLDGVEVAIFARQRLAERRQQPRFVAAGGQVARDELAGLVDLLLAVEQRQELGQDRRRAVRRSARPSAGARAACSGSDRGTRSSPRRRRRAAAAARARRAWRRARRDPARRRRSGGCRGGWRWRR